MRQLQASPQWQDVLTRNGWTGAYLAGADFVDFLSRETALVNEIMADLGLS